MPVTIIRMPTRQEYKAILAQRAEAHKPCHWGKVIKELREEHDLSQRELAAIAKINRNALRKLEQDPKSSSFDIIEKIASVLGFEFDLHAIQKSPFVELPAT